ncbi:MAG: hypothetical protein WBE53_12155, partial [Pseudolabrys sp.]
IIVNEFVRDRDRLIAVPRNYAALTGALALAAVSLSEARNGRNAAAIGFGVGAVAGAVIAVQQRLLRVLRRAGLRLLTGLRIWLVRLRLLCV